MRNLCRLLNCVLEAILTKALVLDLLKFSVIAWSWRCDTVYFQSGKTTLPSRAVWF